MDNDAISDRRRADADYDHEHHNPNVARDGCLLLGRHYLCPRKP
jgi:hypothetical protein